MHNAEKISRLADRCGNTVQVFERKRLLRYIPLTVSRGWLWIEKKDGYWTVILASGQTCHKPLLAGPAFGADVCDNNGERHVGPGHLTGAWKSNLSLWPITEESEANRIFDLIMTNVDLAYRYHFAAGGINLPSDKQGEKMSTQ